MANTFVIGDIHGRYTALVDVLQQANFDYTNDTLISLGDIVDGGNEVYQCVEELLKIKNFILILGNHDVWFMSFISSGWHDKIWLHQGGINTLQSYNHDIKPDDFSEVNIPVTHQEFFNKGIYFYSYKNMCFVHGGFDDTKPLHETLNTELLWDRELWHTAMRRPIKKWEGYKENGVWDKVFIGHSTTQSFYNNLIPLKFNNLWMLDTGAGWNGKLTLMNVDTEEYWQSKIQEPCR